MKNIIRAIFKILFRIEITGLENYKKAGEKVLIIANHLSYLDAVLLVLFLPDKLMFAINSHVAKRWYIKPLLFFVEAFSLDPTNSMATKSIIHEIRKGKKCMIFPEGRITLTGSLMKVYQGPALIAEKAGAKILPIHISGAERSFFSKLKGVQKRTLFPKICINILEPRDFVMEKKMEEGINARERRKLASDKLYDVMSSMQFESSKYNKTIFSALIDASNIYGNKHIIAEDRDRKPLSYKQLFMRAFLLGEKFERDTKQDDFVGILLPNSLGAISTFFALQSIGRVPAMLNFSCGITNIQNACITANLKVVYTARAFIEACNLHALVEAMEEIQVRILYLEDIKSTISTLDTVKAYFMSFMPKLFYKRNLLKEEINLVNKTRVKSDSQKPCVVLFTSGSEGTPKGVVLSHENILVNIAQSKARIDFNPKDILFNALPIFHSFGLTGGTLLPLLSGVRTFFYPSPLHYRIIPELVYDTCATMMFGTDTFLWNYGKYAHVYDFSFVRYIFSGAEKLKEQTRELYANKFGVRIFEGYGATETSPILSLNTPLYYKKGTVGRLLPEINFKLEKVHGIESGGRLFVNGKNIMLGYLKHDKPAIIQTLPDNIYDTGDIVDIDEDGFVRILGRIKRFAKIAGEMVSLTAVEEMVEGLWKQAQHAVLSMEDSKKGEALLLITTQKDATRETLLRFAKEKGIPELYIPKKVAILDAIPLLGTGKVDYVELKKII